MSSTMSSWAKSMGETPTFCEVPDSPEPTRYDALREVLLDWDNHTLRDVVTDACRRDDDLVNLILDNDMLGGTEEEDRILHEANRMDDDGKILPAPALCGGAKTPSQEHAKYKEALHG